MPRIAVEVVVTGSQIAKKADGATALVLHTQAGGSIVFVVDHATLPLLRQAVDKAALALQQVPGRA